MKTCLECKNFEEIRHRGQRYLKGKCLIHYAERIPDGYKIHLTISGPGENTCSSFKEKHVHRLYITVNGDLECFNEDCDFVMEKDEFMKILSDQLAEKDP